VKDNLLRETLAGAAGRGEPPVGDAFARFETARARSNIVRSMIVAFVAIALAASFVWVLPNPFESGSPADFQGGGELDPTRRFVGRYEDPDAGFALSFPADWHARGVHGEYAEFFVADLERAEPVSDVFEDGDAVIELPHTFFVRITALPATDDDRAGIPEPALDQIATAGGSVDREALAATAPAQFRDAGILVRFPPEPVGAAPAYWCEGCFSEQVVVRLVPEGLDRRYPDLLVRIVAPDERQFRTYEPFALDLLDSIERLTGKPATD
jgi:hypothetical protein